MDNSGHAAADSEYDNIGLLSGTQVSKVQVSSAVDDETSNSSIRGRRHSRDITNAEADSLSDYSILGDASHNAPSPKTPGPASGQSTASSLLHRLTTLRAPKSKGKSTRGTPRANYDTLEDGDGDNIAVDLSSLAGLGYELTEMPRPRNQVFPDQETAYQPPSTSHEKPDFRTFVQRNSRIGDGMVIGAHLRRHPSQSVEVGHATSSGLMVDHDRAASSRLILDDNVLQRARTTRNVGHSLAQERQMIVAVNEGIDLSSLEGTHINHRASTQSLATMATRAGTFAEIPQSYFFPEDPDVPDWRPFSMRTPYIVLLASVSLGLAIFQEWLCRHSEKLQKTNKGGILSFDAVADISTWAFFAWKYLPTMVTIFYAVLFSIMDFDIRRLEPYYQLSQPLGSRAAASLNLDHLTMFQYFVPFKAFRLGQWTVFLSTIGNIIASTVAPSIQNPSLDFVQNKHCKLRKDNPFQCLDGEHQFHVIVSAPWSRALSSVLFIVFLIIVAIYILLRRKSGLLSDPKGIAGIASMATKSHILQDFKGLDLATRARIHKQLQHRRFILYKSSIWQGEWSAANEPMQDPEHRLASPHPHMLRMSFGIPFLAFMVFALVAVPIISLTRARIVPNTVPWLPILLATLLKLVFATFEADVRLIEPFYRLSRRNADYSVLTMDYSGTVYGWIVVQALVNKHYLVALVGLASMSLDVLTVTVSSFSVNSATFLAKTMKDVSNQDETFISFWTSVILSIAILLFVIGTTSLVYWRRRHPFLPREPSTIAAVLAFIYASKMLDDFINTETFTHKQMEDWLKQKGKTYALAWFIGRDGKPHCAIDEEPILSKYVHGKPYTSAIGLHVGQDDYYV